MSTKTLPEHTSQSAHVRISRANTLRMVSRLSYAVDSIALPSPAAVTFRLKGELEVMWLRFDSIADAKQWTERLHGHNEHEQSFSRVRVYRADALWRGFAVEITGSDPVGDR